MIVAAVGMIAHIAVESEVVVVVNTVVAQRLEQRMLVVVEA